MDRICLLQVLLLAGTFSVSPRPATGSLVINELAPDPAGADAGWEFVEILNTSDVSENLEGVSIDFANGAEGAVWRVRWVAAGGLVLAPGARFLVADRNWLGAVRADVEVWLGLQNGPDAVRLARDGVGLDLVGWGALTDPELMEGTPAAAVTGASLARRPDGWDSGDNGADFVAGEPTPGEPNFLPWDLTVVAARLEPPSLPRAGDPLLLDVEVRNDGIEPWPVTVLELRVGAQEGTALLDACPAGAVRRFGWQVRPAAPGQFPLTARAVAPEGRDTVALDLGAVQVGAGALVLSEVMAAPRRDEGEWVELEAVRACELDRWRLRDEDGEWRDLPACSLAAGARVVLAQDAAALAAWLLEVRSRGGLIDCAGNVPVVLELSGWPGLNNTAPESRIFAERLWLADSTGVVVDHVAVGGPDGRAPDGLSWERAGTDPVHPVGANWGTCTARTGATPGCPNSLALPGEAGFALVAEPAVLDPAAGTGALHLRFRLAEGENAWRVRVYDLWGAPVRDFGGDELGTGPRDLVWDGRDDRGVGLPAGGYVVLLLVLDDGGRPLRRDRVLVVVR